MKPAKVVVSISLIVVVLALAAVARSAPYASYWTDARSAGSWENPLCSRLSGFRGLAKARRVEVRTKEIARESRLVEKDDTGLYLWSTPKGQFWMPQENDLSSLATILAEQEQEMYGRSGGLGVRPGDIVIDAGAHVGLFTKTALAAGAAKVVTFEVTPKSLQCLRRNLAQEIQEGRVVVEDMGVWNEEGTLGLSVALACSACNSLMYSRTKTIQVPLTTIDKAVDRLKLEHVDFIKLDIENAEANALRGAKTTLARFHPRVAVAIENADDRIAYAHEIKGLMAEAFPGYRYECGACTNPESTNRILPEVLHFYSLEGR